jgi:hypothetical protein
MEALRDEKPVPCVPFNFQEENRQLGMIFQRLLNWLKNWVLHISRLQATESALQKVLNIAKA